MNPIDYTLYPMLEHIKEAEERGDPIEYVRQKGDGGPGTYREDPMSRKLVEVTGPNRKERRAQRKLQRNRTR